jgi:uroporphyrinogen-III synthase
MSESLKGQVIALAEGRQLEELALMLENEGASVIRCPMVSILDASDHQAIQAWLHELIADRFSWVVLYTGEGVRRLSGFAQREGVRDAFIKALGRTKTITRGPKPVRALKELGLAPTLMSAMPTTDGLIASLQNEPLRGLTVGVQLFGDTPLALLPFLERAGAMVRTVLPYVYAPASEADRVEALLRDMADGKINIIVFTSSPQVARIYDVAKERRLEKCLDEGWAKVKVAAVGPVVADELKLHGVPVDICPDQGFVMKNLVQHIKRSVNV